MKAARVFIAGVLQGEVHSDDPKTIQRAIESWRASAPPGVKLDITVTDLPVKDA